MVVIGGDGRVAGKIVLSCNEEVIDGYEKTM